MTRALTELELGPHVAEPKVFYRCKRCGHEMERDGTQFTHVSDLPAERGQAAGQVAMKKERR